MITEHPLNVRNAEALLKQMLEMYRDMSCTGPGLVYQLGYDFVLQHGTVYTPNPFPRGVLQGKPKCCYGNAILLAGLRGYRYIEGYALGANVPHPIHHAWNLNGAGELIDNTWRNTGSVYMGVEFSVERADEATCDGDGSILDDWKRGFPIFRQQWSGEDFSIVWPQSVNHRMALLRGGKLEELADLIERDTR